MSRKVNETLQDYQLDFAELQPPYVPVCPVCLEVVYSLAEERSHALTHVPMSHYAKFDDTDDFDFFESMEKSTDGQ